MTVSCFDCKTEVPSPSSMANSMALLMFLRSTPLSPSGRTSFARTARSSSSFKCSFLMAILRKCSTVRTHLDLNAFHALVPETLHCQPSSAAVNHTHCHCLCHCSSKTAVEHHLVVILQQHSLQALGNLEGSRFRRIFHQHAHSSDKRH